MAFAPGVPAPEGSGAGKVGNSRWGLAELHRARAGDHCVPSSAVAPRLSVSIFQDPRAPEAKRSLGGWVGDRDLLEELPG